MSSNAFPRSRSRVRHNRTPRILSCDHPRFLQLVNEIGRINRSNSHQHHQNSANQSQQQISSTDSPLMNNNQPQTQRQQQKYDPQHHTAPSQQQQQYVSSSNNLHHNNQHHNQDDCCPITKQDTTANFGYSKQNLHYPEQQPQQNTSSSDFSKDNLPDLRSQDENRSKRKRPSNDSIVTNARKSSSSSSCAGNGSAGGMSKRHKSSPDNVRPLSPSFTKCPICLLDTMDRNPSFTNTCFHLFCYVCIDNWTKSKATCPLCRTKFTKIIHNIKSSTNYQEQIVSPIRRDDDDGYIADRLMLEHLSSLNSNPTNSNRNSNSDEVQFLYENLRGPDVLMPQIFINQIDPRQGDPVHSFNTATTSTSFNSNVPHSPFTHTSYPMAPNYIALFPSRAGLGPTPNPPMASAYTTNTSLTNLNNDPNARQVSRRGGIFFPRNYEPPMVSDSSTRPPRVSATSATQQIVNLDRNHHHHNHHHQQQHPHSHQPQHHPGHHQHQHQHHHPRSSVEIRQAARSEPLNAPHLQQAFYIRHHQHPVPSAYARRLYNNPQVDHHLLDTLYRNMPDSS